MLTRNISWSYLEAGVGVVVYFFLTPIVVERLGAVGFGIWVLLNAILFYLKFLDFGFYNALVKYVAEYSERREWPTVNGLIATTVVVLAVAGVAAFLGAGIVAWLLVPNVFNVPADHIAELQIATVLIGLDLVLAFPASALSAVLEGRQRFDILSAISIPLRVAGAVVTVLVLDAGFGVIGLVWITIATTVVDGIVCLVALRQLFPEIHLGIASIARAAHRRHLAQVRGYSTWTSLNEILAEGGAEIEKLLLPVLLSVSLLTPYTLIVTVCAAVFLVIEPITDTFFPLSSAYDAGKDKGRLRELLTRGTKIVVGVSLPIAVAVTFYGRDFIVLWIGEGVVAIPEHVLPLVVASFAVTAFILTGTTILLAMGRVQQVFWMGIAELALAVLLVLATVPRTGLVGLAGSLLAANVVITGGWIVPYVCRLLGQGLGGFIATGFVRPALAALPMALVLLGIDRVLPGDSLWRIGLNSAVAGAVYLAAFYGMSLTSAERTLFAGSVREMLRKTPA